MAIFLSGLKGRWSSLNGPVTLSQRPARSSERCRGAGHSLPRQQRGIDTVANPDGAVAALPHGKSAHVSYRQGHVRHKRDRESVRQLVLVQSHQLAAGERRGHAFVGSIPPAAAATGTRGALEACQKLVAQGDGYHHVGAGRVQSFADGQDAWNDHAIVAAAFGVTVVVIGLAHHGGVGKRRGFRIGDHSPAGDRAFHLALVHAAHLRADAARFRVESRDESGDRIHHGIPQAGDHTVGEGRFRQMKSRRKRSGRDVPSMGPLPESRFASFLYPERVIALTPLGGAEEALPLLQARPTLPERQRLRRRASSS